MRIFHISFDELSLACMGLTFGTLYNVYAAYIFVFVRVFPVLLRDLSSLFIISAIIVHYGYFIILESIIYSLFDIASINSHKKYLLISINRSNHSMHFLL